MWEMQAIEERENRKNQAYADLDMAMMEAEQLKEQLNFAREDVKTQTGEAKTDTETWITELETQLQENAPRLTAAQTVMDGIAVAEAARAAEEDARWAKREREDQNREKKMVLEGAAE